jgi:hypothetical protein
MLIVLVSLVEAHLKIKKDDNDEHALIIIVSLVKAIIDMKKRRHQ